MNKIVISVSLFATHFLLFLVSFVRAEDDVIETGGGAGSLTNPLGDKDITAFLKDILDVIMVFAIPLIVFMIIYAGFIYVMARGNESEVGKAHRALLYVVIGGVIIIGANVILAVIQGTVAAFRT